MKIKQLEYLPKFYSREETRQKHKEIKNKIDELVASGKLFQREEEKLKTYDEEFPLSGDAYTRNYIIREINKIISYVNSR